MINNNDFLGENNNDLNQVNYIIYLLT